MAFSVHPPSAANTADSDYPGSITVHFSDAEIYRSLVENSLDMLTLATPERRRIYVSPSCLDVTGYRQDELVGNVPDHIVHPEDKPFIMALLNELGPQAPTARAVWRLMRPDGSYRWMETTYRWLPDGRYVAIVRDVQEQKETQDRLQAALHRLETLVMQDPLTGIPNRRCFMEAIDAPPTRAAVLLIDLDRFKSINDIHGHAVGDAVLVAVARRFQTRVRAVLGRAGLDEKTTTKQIAAAGATNGLSVVARLGGDEFAVLLRGNAVDQAAMIASEMVRAARATIRVDGLRVRLGASVGVAISSLTGSDMTTLMSNADKAMYEVKRRGRSGFYLFNSRLTRAAPDPIGGGSRMRPRTGALVRRRPAYYQR